ncbi:hypothetical protein BZA77DRAFT_385701 [Pyronema omphalodes]|nr:hypothetical protein BZA77DRAFT_385701 [Pyronema omphalodes]
MTTLFNFTAYFRLLATLFALAYFAKKAAALPKGNRGGTGGSQTSSGGGDSGISSEILSDTEIAGIVIGCVSALVLLWLAIATWKSVKRKKMIEYERARIADESGDSVPHAIVAQKQDAMVDMIKKKKKTKGHWLNNWEWF